MATDEAAVRYNAERAKAVLEDRVVSEAWAAVERGYIEKALDKDATDEQRREFAYRVNALRDVRVELEGLVTAAGSLDRRNPNQLP